MTLEEDVEELVGGFRDSAELLKGIGTVEQLEENKEVFLQNMEKAFASMVSFLREALEMPPEEQEEFNEQFKQLFEDRERYEQEIDAEMQRLEELPGATGLLDKMAEEMAERIGPKMEEMAELMMQFMGGLMGDVMQAIGGAMGEMMGDFAGEMEEMNQPVYICAECDHLTLKGESCINCGSDKQIVKCNLCLAVLEDESKPRCQNCLENANKCPHCHADLTPELPESCPHCGKPPKEEKTCPECENIHYEDGDLCDCCQAEANKKRCPECGGEMYEDDEYCTECYEKDFDGNLVKLVKCPKCGEKAPETEETCFACGEKLK